MELPAKLDWPCRMIFVRSGGYAWGTRLAVLLTGVSPWEHLRQRTKLKFHQWGGEAMPDWKWTIFLNEMPTDEFINLMLLSPKPEEDDAKDNDEFSSAEAESMGEGNSGEPSAHDGTNSHDCS